MHKNFRKRERGIQARNPTILEKPHKRFRDTGWLKNFFKYFIYEPSFWPL